MREEISMKKRITVTDLISVENIKSWESGDTIVISAGTGTGKSYFVKNKLTTFARSKNKKILFLIHRTQTVNQFTTETKREGKSHIIEIKTYQSLEAKLRKNEEINFSEYAYIVLDEFHYFLNDAAFNKFTDLSLRKILDTDTAAKIFMSATGEETLRYIENIEKTTVKERYSIVSNHDYINSIKFYNDENTLKRIMNEWIKTGEKALIFIQSDSKAYYLYKEFKEYSTFNCSKNNKDYYKYVNEDKIEEILSKERFENQFLITTTVMDAGVNLIDTKLNNIVVDVKNIGSLIQAVGRKRMQNNDDTVNLYIKNVNDKELNLIKGNLAKRVEMAKFLKNNGDKKFIEEYYRRSDASGIIYLDNDFKLRINKLMYNNTLLSIIENSCIKNKGKNGYAKFILEKFGKENEDVVILEVEKKEKTIENYLRNNVNKRLYKKDRDNLINVVCLKDARGRLKKSVSILNNYLIDNFNYTLHSKKVKENGKLITVWVISKIE